MIGAPVSRYEGPLKVSGQAPYAYEVKPPSPPAYGVMVPATIARGRITAIDLNTGDHKWMVPNADTPQWLKDIPALSALDIPPTGNPDRVGMLVTKTLLFAGEGSGMYASDFPGGNKLRAYDKATGKVIAQIELPANQTGVPMNYSVNKKQYIVIAVGAPGIPGELVALGL